MSHSEPRTSGAVAGIVFDVREFAVHDGPGIRTTVFLKGCPLACTWCHNPEGRSPRPQIMRSPSGRRVAGTAYTADELATILRRHADTLRESGGGVTFSGGEPLRQARFVAAVIDRLEGLHVVLDTCGFGSAAAFRRLVLSSDLVFMDVKLVDPAAHRRWAGRDNERIRANLAALPALGRPYVVRVPLIPGVTDTPANLSAIAGLVGKPDNLLRVDLLPYNRAGGGKYAACGMAFEPGFDEDRPPEADTAPFERAGIEVRVA